MCSAESRKEIVECNLVRDVNRSQAKTPLVFVSAKEIVVTNGDIEYVPGCGGNIPNPITTLVVAYRWGCDNNGNGTYSCTNKEEYHLAQRYGLVQWKHFVSSGCDSNGKCNWGTATETSTHSELVSGTPPAPNVPCLD